MFLAFVEAEIDDDVTEAIGLRTQVKKRAISAA